MGSARKIGNIPASRDGSTFGAIAINLIRANLETCGEGYFGRKVNPYVMVTFGDDSDPDTHITIAQIDGKIKGFQYYVPWTTTGLSLDRMQRERGTDAGINELMIVETVEFARTHNFSHVSLNFAAFRSLFERADKISAGPITRSTRNLIRFASNFFQVESLYRFNAKFQPEWETRYVLYPRAADLPRVAWAALRAEKFISGFRKKSV
jgi:lysyl-tRNA synthetase class 2